MNTRIALMQRLYDESAARYRRDIEPVFAPLAADLIAYAEPRRDDRALDIGTGTGLAARYLAPYVRLVIGVDISLATARAALATPGHAHVHYLQSDIHRLPFRAGAFSLVVSSFGLNGTDPNDSLRAVRQVVAPGGRLVLQEWGPVTAIDQAIDNLMTDHITDEPTPSMAHLRAWREENPREWNNQLQDVDDYHERLGEIGFEVEDAIESAPVAIRVRHPKDYLRYKLAWTYRFEEVKAMDEESRAAFYAGARALLADAAEPDGSLVFQPVLFRITARLKTPAP